MNHDLKTMLDAFTMDSDSARASRILRECMENKLRRMLNVDVTPTDGSPDNGAKIPNVYTNKRIKKSEKKLPKLKRGVYGTGVIPSSVGEVQAGDGGGE